VDLDIGFRGGDGLRIAGLLATPAGQRAVPGVVFVGGSGPSDRDNDGFFVPLREHLRRDGIAVLSYDKRGVGGSDGRWETATLDELAADASASLTWLRHQPRVDPGRVSMFGHSEGGWVALRACLAAESPARVVLNSCPGVSFLDSEVFALEAAGTSAAEAAQAGSLLRELAEMADAGQGLNAGRDRIAAARGQTWLDRLEAVGFDLNEVLWSQLRAWGTYDPGPDLTRCTAPTVALFGADDPLVPVQASIDAYDRTAILAGRDHVNRVFPQAGHRMAASDSGEMVPGYLGYLSRSVSMGPG